MRDSKTTRFKKGIRLTDEDYKWIRHNKKKKSAAGFLEEIIKCYKNGNERLQQVSRK